MLLLLSINVCETALQLGAGEINGVRSCLLTIITFRRVNLLQQSVH